MTEPEWVGDIEFDGNLREYAAIALMNLLLTIVTLGIYRFWGKTRIRRYLWSRTIFMGDRLEWAGTGKELFRGALMALLLVILPLSLVNFAVRELVAHGHRGLGGGLSLLEAAAFYALIGAGTFRAQRYRLSRTYWRGIHGGSADPGLRYGAAYVWKNALGMVAMGLLMPWAMVSLWNQRWNAMSFGSWSIASHGRVAGLKLRFLLCYLAPVLGMGAAMLLMRSHVVVTFWGVRPTTVFGHFLVMLPAIFGFLFVFALVIAAYYACFFRQMVGSMALDPVSFRFNAGALEWMELYLVDVILVIATMGIGALFLSYRHWTFHVRYLQADGRIDAGALTRSVTAAPTQGEGLLDAFDMGAL